ncbi:MAG: ATP-binding protein [Acidobacteriota bacterium]
MAMSAAPLKSWDSVAAPSIVVCNATGCDKLSFSTMASKAQKLNKTVAGNLKTAKPAPRTRKLSHSNYIFFMSMLAGLPAVIFSMVFLWQGDYTAKVQWTFSLLIIGFWFGCSLAVRERVIFPLQTLSNLLAALREGDFSIRARGAMHNDALGEALFEVNSLGQILREQRLEAFEATQLLRTVMTEIDVAVFAFDDEKKLRLVNRAGEKLLAQPMERLTKSSAGDLGLADYLEDEAIRTVQQTFPGGASRWEIRRTTFRERGVPHQLLVISDVSRALREEERLAWQRIIRVLGHELNNSLAPIKSIAGSLESMIFKDPLPDDWRDDARRGFSIITGRVASLTRFMEGYSRLAKLPPPQYQPVEIGALIQRLVNLETRMKIRLLENPEIVIRADSDQLEQLLINIIRNAVDASLETRGNVQVSWRRRGDFLEVLIEDEGHGIANSSNLFVPFFTTKPNGSGIGLVLSRQIAEAHGGTLTLVNKKTGHGCEAKLRIPTRLTAASRIQ